MTIRVICAGCGQGGPWQRTTGRAITCPTCKAERESTRNASRPHYLGDYRRRRRAALRRTGGCCSSPGCPTPRDRVEVHHVDPGSPSSQLIPLCHDHHVSTFTS